MPGGRGDLRDSRAHRPSADHADDRALAARFGHRAILIGP
jgi:hypothetical protein